MQRRSILLGTAGLLASGAGRAVGRVGRVDYPAVLRRPLVLPRDHGAHPEYRTEWWYLTGWLDGGAAPLGVQVTFFRVRPPIAADHPSRFAATQLIIGHVALADPAAGRLVHDERIARAGFDLAYAAETDTDIKLDRWRMQRAADGRYVIDIPARGFELRLTATPTQPLLLQGEQGYSRKGPQPANASFYYSQPQLALATELTRDGRREQRRGIAWLDHEWSSSVLDERAAGWDWIGMNLDDGSALTAFQIRPRDGAPAALYAYAARRGSDGGLSTFAPDQVRFAPLTLWTSPRTRTRWPVAQRIDIGGEVFTTEPLLPDQELDSRATTGSIYWEGASRLYTAGRPVGRGYLEMTGYAAPIVL
jgi:predicted secreted hydrolase